MRLAEPIAPARTGVAAKGGRAPALRVVDPSIVRLMRMEMRGETDKALVPQFGISYNTWRKVRAGEPIRRSVADRVEERVRRQAGRREG